MDLAENTHDPDALDVASMPLLFYIDTNGNLYILVHPTVLYTGSICASVVTTWNYVTVSGLSAWKEARLWIAVGDAFAGYKICTCNNITAAVSAYVSAAYAGAMRICCDFSNNKVGVYVISDRFTYIL